MIRMSRSRARPLKNAADSPPKPICTSPLETSCCSSGDDPTRTNSALIPCSPKYPLASARYAGAFPTPGACAILTVTRSAAAAGDAAGTATGEAAAAADGEAPAGALCVGFEATAPPVAGGGVGAGDEQATPKASSRTTTQALCRGIGTLVNLMGRLGW